MSGTDFGCSPMRYPVLAEDMLLCAARLVGRREGKSLRCLLEEGTVSAYALSEIRNRKKKKEKKKVKPNTKIGEIKHKQPQPPYRLWGPGTTGSKSQGTYLRHLLEGGNVHQPTRVLRDARGYSCTTKCCICSAVLVLMLRRVFVPGEWGPGTTDSKSQTTYLRLGTVLRNQIQHTLQSWYKLYGASGCLCVVSHCMLKFNPAFRVPGTPGAEKRASNRFRFRIPDVRAMRCPVLTLACATNSAICLRTCYAMPGTDLACAATRRSLQTQIRPSAG
eukprot:1965049-Rhodomonas_salina.1